MCHFFAKPNILRFLKKVQVHSEKKKNHENTIRNVITNNQITASVCPHTLHSTEIKGDPEIQLMLKILRGSSKS